MEYLPNGIQLEIPPGCFPLTTDSVLLAHFANSTHAQTVLDLGSGCGTLGLMLCAANPCCHVTGVELAEAAHLGAEENIRRNGLNGRMASIRADLRQVSSLFSPGSFSCCISNPPYFSGGPASHAGPARREDACTLEDLLQAAAWAVKFGGDVFLVHRPERLGEILALGSRFRLEGKRLALVRHAEGQPISLLLFQLRKGGKPGLKLEDWVLHDAQGRATALYHEIYHIREE